MVSIAIIGLNGQLGRFTVKALLSEPFVSKVSSPIKLLTTSPDKKIVDSDKVQYIAFNRDGSDAEKVFTDALKGVEVLVNLSNPFASPGDAILNAAAANGVKLYIPSQFGTDLQQADKTFPGFLSPKTQHTDNARAKGIKTIDVYTGLFIDENQLFLGKKFSVNPFDEEKKELTVIGDEKTKVNPSFLSDVGKVVASISTNPNYKDLPDTIRTFSDFVTLGDLIAHYEKSNNTKLTLKYWGAADIIAKAKEAYKDFQIKDFVLYLQAFVAGGEGNGVIYETDNHRELVNPKESLFKWTKYVI